MDDLLSRHEAFALRLARERLRGSGAPFEAEDIVQEVWAALLEEGAKRLDPAGFRPYLAAAVLNTARLRLRAWGRAAVRDRDHARLRSREDPLFLKETSEEVSAAMARLPWRQQLLLRWIYWDGMSYAQAASLARIPENSVGPALSAAREELKKALRMDGLPA